MIMNIPNIIIAVDGYSSTGKSTFAKLIAKTYSFLYLDSGALYRAVTLFALENTLIHENAEIEVDALEQSLSSLDVHFEYVDGQSMTFIGDRCVETEIRTLKVSNYVSPIATVPQVRNFVDSKLHEFGKNGRIVMDGRDIGTTVFPNAELKLFMVAGNQIRAMRRYDEMVAKGQHPEFEEVMKNLKERDYIDSHRETSPLRQAEDAIILDNSYLTMENQMAWLEMVLKNKFDI